MSNSERENTMFLLKAMVLLCIVCVFVTLYAEYRRMSKFERVLRTLTSGLSPQAAGNSSPGRTGARHVGASPLSASNDTESHTPTL